MTSRIVRIFFGCVLAIVAGLLSAVALFPLFPPVPLIGLVLFAVTFGLTTVLFALLWFKGWRLAAYVSCLLVASAAGMLAMPGVIALAIGEWQRTGLLSVAAVSLGVAAVSVGAMRRLA